MRWCSLWLYLANLAQGWFVQQQKEQQRGGVDCPTPKWAPHPFCIRGVKPLKVENHVPAVMHNPKKCILPAAFCPRLPTPVGKVGASQNCRTAEMLHQTCNCHAVSSCICRVLKDILFWEHHGRSWVSFRKQSRSSSTTHLSKGGFAIQVATVRFGFITTTRRGASRDSP